MALSFGSKPEDVMSLIARKNYAKAIEVLRGQIEANRHDPRLRLQLGDVLVSAGKDREAVGILAPLAEEFARDGFAAKAIAVLKKIQKIDPGRRDIEARLASLIQDKQRVAVAASPASSYEIGMEEIGLEFPVGRPDADAAEPVASASETAVSAEPEPLPESEPLPELDLMAPREPPLSLVPPSMPLPPEEPPSLSSLPVPDETLALAEPEPLSLEPSSPAIEEGAPPPLPLVPPEVPAAARAVSVIEDPDLLYLDDVTEEGGPVEPEVEVVPEVEAEPENANPMSDSRFADELQALVDVAFLAPAASSDEPGAPVPRAPGGSQIVVSPLFRDFSVDEMVAVIAGLNLLSFERGDVILREGQPGDSLYMLTSGMVRAFRKGPGGKQERVADLHEGAFFGEVSILTGGPRTATVAALTRCELLELDRATLDSIRASHPHVWDVLEEFARQRTAKRS